MRSGPSSPKRKPTATAPTRLMTTRETTVTMSPSTPNTAWLSPSCPALAMSKGPRRWWANSAVGPGIGRCV